MTEGTAGACVTGVKFLDPEFGGLADTIDHGGLADAWIADQKKGGV